MEKVHWKSIFRVKNNTHPFSLQGPEKLYKYIASHKLYRSWKIVIFVLFVLVVGGRARLQIQLQLISDSVNTLCLLLHDLLQFVNIFPKCLLDNADSFLIYVLTIHL